MIGIGSDDFDEEYVTEDGGTVYAIYQSSMLKQGTNKLHVRYYTSAVTYTDNEISDSLMFIVPIRNAKNNYVDTEETLSSIYETSRAVLLGKFKSIVKPSQLGHMYRYLKTPYTVNQTLSYYTTSSNPQSYWIN
jgi:hypothetical protein